MRIRLALIAVGAALVPALAMGSPIVIVSGSTYLASHAGHYDFGPDTGVAFFHGVPLSVLGDADSILHRLEDATFATIGSTAVIPIEMIAIRAESNDPISLNGRLFNFGFSLTPNTRSMGYMDITLGRQNDGTFSPHGTYTTHVTLNFSTLFTPVDNSPGAFTVDGSIFIESIMPGAWSFNPGPDYCVDEGEVGDITANVHRNLPPGFGDFFTIGPMPMEEVASGNGGIHSPCKFTPVPEPSSFILLATGIFAASWFAATGRWRKTPRGRAS